MDVQTFATRVRVEFCCYGWQWNPSGVYQQIPVRKAGSSHQIPYLKSRVLVQLINLGAMGLGQGGQGLRC